MKSEQAELYEELAEDEADVMVAAIKILMQLFVRVRQKMPFEEWFDIYMENQGYTQEEFLERMIASQEKLDGLAHDDKLIVFDMALRKIPEKVERLEIPGPVKGFFSNLINLIPPLTAEQPPVYECDNCHQQFSLPQEDFDEVACSNCGRKWTKEDLPKLKMK